MSRLTYVSGLSADASIASVIAGLFHVTAAKNNVIVSFRKGVTHIPFTLAILVLEMTDRHNIIFQLMLAGMMASIASMIVDKHSLYDHLKVQYMPDILQG